MTRGERDEGGAHEEQRLRRVLEAAAARPDEVPEPSPFLGPRLRARIAAAQGEGVAPQPLAGVGALAWRMVPVLALALALLGVWTGVESARADQAMDEAVTSVAEPTEIVGEALGDEPPESLEEGR